MNKHEIKDLIYKHFEPKDVGIGVLNCIHEDKDVDKLAENLVNLFSIPVVVKQSELLLCGVCDEETEHDVTLRKELHCLKCGNVAKE